jgi:DNA-directed RNA polymerase specialized sigma24 family protein
MSAESPASDPALLGILALLAADRAERNPNPDVATEVLLHRAGLSNVEIAAIVDKTEGAVRAASSRAGKRGSRGKGTT